jgi:DNA repair exonuclease SbcCD nuclease subunit
MKILFTADLHLSDKKYEENEFLLRQIENTVDSYEVDSYIIGGDIFDTNSPIETIRNQFRDHLKIVSVFPKVKEIIVIDGNHDIKQRRSNLVINTSNSEVRKDDVLKLVCDDIDKVFYCDETSYWDSKHFDCSYIVYSQRTKHYDPENYFLSKENFQKFIDYSRPKNVITLFHDPFTGCKAFSGGEMKGPTMANWENFHTQLILAGDIHKHGLYSNGMRDFWYAGSPAIVNYGEGDYYGYGGIITENSKNHGVLIVDIREGEREVEHAILKQHTVYATVDLNCQTDADIQIVNFGQKKTLLKLRVNSMDDYFMKKMYDGEILKTVNMRDLTLAQQVGDGPDALKLAQDSIENQLQFFRKQLWVQPDTTTVANVKAKKTTVKSSRSAQTTEKAAKTEQPKAPKPEKSSAAPTKSVRRTR